MSIFGSLVSLDFSAFLDEAHPVSAEKTPIDNAAIDSVFEMNDLNSIFLTSL